MIYVIGSGPAGVSCAVALVAKGHRVTMIDAGIELESERDNVRQKLASTQPDRWDSSAVQFLKSQVEATAGGLPIKLAYGSDFPFRDVDSFVPIEMKGVHTVFSLARGGLSNVWGAVVLPYSSSDIADWPITAGELAPHYRSVLSFIPYAAKSDDLATRLPLYVDPQGELKPSRQAVAFLEDMRKHKEALGTNGIVFGSSRLAVATDGYHPQRSCIYCGLCMYGCPYEVIYNSSFTLERLKADVNFTYCKDIVVRKVDESNGTVQIVAESRRTRQPLRFEGSRVYLACGVFPTTRLLLESLGAYHHPLAIKDSQYFVLPLLRYRKTGGVTEELLYTLAQIVIDIVDSALCKNIIHLQIYTYNDLYGPPIKRFLGPAKFLFSVSRDEFIGRLLVIQGFLHSASSPEILATLKPADAGGNYSRLVLEGTKNTHTVRVIRGVCQKLWENRKHLQAVPLTPLLKIGQPGSGFHSGGSFPMNTHVTEFKSDVLGRPYGFKRVHAVDATVFPSIPATSITLSVMANAHRIASQCEAA